MNDVAIGHNRPDETDATFDALQARTIALAENADKWAQERPEIKSEDEATKAGDFLDQLRAAFKEIEAERKKVKQPHLDAAKAVDEQYNPLKRPVELSAGLIKGLLDPWLRKKEAEVEAERKRKAEEARKAQEEADRRAREAAEAASKGGSVIQSTIEAEQAQARAEEAARAARRAEHDRAKVGSAYGGRAKSRRTREVPRITSIEDIPLEVFQMAAQEAYVRDALLRFFKANMAVARMTKGVEIYEESMVA